MDSNVGYTGYVWKEAEYAKKKLRIQKYPDTCERGLSNDDDDNENVITTIGLD